MFLTIKKIPKTSWSSKKPFNLKPKFSTLLYLCFGLTLFGLGEGLLLVSLTGASRYECIRILSECDGNIDEAVNIISMNNRDRIRSSIRGTNRIGGLELLRNLAMEIIRVPNSTENPTENPTENSSENSKKEETKESLSETLDILREMKDN